MKTEHADRIGNFALLSVDEFFGTKPKMKTQLSHQYSLHAGRAITRDGQPFALIARAVETVSPVDLDAFARLCAAAPDLLAVARKFIEGCERGEQVGEKFFSGLLDEARAACAKT